MFQRKMPLTAFFATILLLVAIGMIGGLGAIYYVFEFARRMTGLQANSAILADQAATSLELAAWNFDDAQLRKITGAIMQVPNVYGVKLQVKDVSSPGGVKRQGLVRDTQWHPIIQDTDFSGAGAGALELERPIVSSEGEPLGSVKLYITPKFMEADLRQRLIDLVVAFIILAAILTASLYVLMWRAILRPLRLLEQYAGKVSGETGGAKVITSRPFRGELQKLRGSIEKMVDLLAARYASLRHNQTMLAGVLNSTPQSIFWKDLESKYLGCNESFARLAGLSCPEQIVGKTDFDLPWPPSASEIYRAVDREIMKTGIAMRHMIESLSPVGGVRIAVETTKLPLLDSSGRVYGVLGVLEDITARLEAEQRIASQLLFEELVARISSMLVAAESSNLDGILNRALQDIARMLDADRVVLGQTDEKTGEMVARAHYRETEPPFPERLVISKRYPFLWRQLRAGHVSHVLDVAELGDEQSVDRRNFEQVGIRSQVTAPVLVEGRLQYILAVASVGRRMDCPEEAVARIKVLAELLATTALRCEAEEVVRSSERQFRTFIEQAPVPIIVVPSPDGSPIYFNPAFTRVFGFTRQELRSPEDWWPLIYPDEVYRSARHASWAKMLAKAKETGEFQDTEELEMCTKSGEMRFAQTRLTVVGGYRMSFINDLTERRRAELALRMTQYAVDNNPVMIYRLGMDGRFLYANEAACNHLGYTSAELLGMYIYDVSGITTRENWTPRSIMVKEQGSSHFETDYFHKDGSSFPLEIWAYHVKFSNEESFFTFAFDIAARKAAEKEVHAHLLRIQRLATELTRAEERQRRELATILHDGVGQSLFAATTQLLTMKNPGNGAGAEVEKVLSLLDQVTRETRELTFELCPPVLYQLGLMPALQRLTDQFMARYGVACVLTGSTAGPMDLNARGLAYQAVRELLNNIAKHAKAKSVTISASEVDNQVHIEVADDGAGFDPADLRPGTGGFGLFHLRERIELLGGSLLIDSAPQHGCRVQLKLPLNVLQSTE